MGSVAPNAVFLSYASQDVERARQIARALRASGVAVWFDQSELRGGDAWDARIKKQIKECTLFIPVISAHTQARSEGYFRREWKAAVERTQDLAEDVTFLVPVVIDATPDVLARVPEKFREVQWTRLPEGETTPAFCDRIQRLLSGKTAAGSTAPVVHANPPGTKYAPATLRSKGLMLVIAAMLAVIGWVAWYRLRLAEPNATSRLSSAPIKTTQAPSNIVQVRRIVAEYERGTLARQFLELGDQLIHQALQVEPANAEAWALASELSQALYAQNYDRTLVRRDAIDAQAANAMKLAPESPDAQFASATALALGVSTLPDAERILRGLVLHFPNEWRYPRALADVLKLEGKDAAAAAMVDKAGELAGKEPVALLFKSDALAMHGRSTEAEEALDLFLAEHPTEAGYLRKFELLFERGDMAAMRRVLSTMPSVLLRNDNLANWAAAIWLGSRDTKRARVALEAAPGNYFKVNYWEGPKAYFEALSYAMEGRRDAASAKWEDALHAIDKRLTEEPNRTILLFLKADILGRLDRKPEAEQVARVFQQLVGNDEPTWLNLHLNVALGQTDDAIALLESWMRAGRLSISQRTSLRFDPRFDSLRGNPRFEALLIER